MGLWLGLSLREKKIYVKQTNMAEVANIREIEKHGIRLIGACSLHITKPKVSETPPLFRDPSLALY